MSIETTYSDLRSHLSEYMDRVVDDCETIVVRRRNGKNVALIAEHELSSMLETAHLMSSPANAERLLTAMREVRAGRGKQTSSKQLRQDIGIEQP